MRAPRNRRWQKAVCDAIRKIPRGRVSTYGAIATAAGYPRYARHVGRVLKQVRGLPWQRVLGSGGRISLRGESAMEQRFLLEAEGVRFRGRRVDMQTSSTGSAGPPAKPPARRPKEYRECSRLRLFRVDIGVAVAYIGDRFAIPLQAL